MPIDIGPEGLFGDIFDPFIPTSSPVGPDHPPSDFPGQDVDIPCVKLID